MSNKLMRKEIDFVLPYVDDEGIEGEKTIHVAFASMRIIEKYNELMQRVASIIGIYQELQKTQQDIGSAIVDTEEYTFTDDGDIDVKKLNLKERRKKYKDLQYKYKEYTDKLNGYSKDDFDKKWELIELILKKNGIADRELLDKEWWKDCVDSHYVMAFIEASCTKDDTLVDVKKKQWAN